MTDIRPDESDADFKMMTSPGSWPLWPRLPLMNRTGGQGGWPRYGFLVNVSVRDETKIVFVDNKTIYAIASEDEAKPVTHDDLRAMIEAGWEID